MRSQRGVLAQQQLALHRHNTSQGAKLAATTHHIRSFSTFSSSHLGLSNNFLAKNPLHVAFTFETYGPTSATKLWFCIWAGIVAATKFPGPFLTINDKLA